MFIMFSIYLNRFPLHFVWDLSHTDNVSTLVTGKTECLREVRTNIRNGADLIKFHATGGAASVNDKIDARQFSDDEIQTITSEATRLGVSVAAHAHGREGIESAINNGVHTIEHGSFLDDNLCKKMKAKNMVYVPTRYIVEFCATMVLNNPESEVNEKSKAKIKYCIDGNRNALKLAMNNGVTIAMGTDMGVWDYWGDNSKELEYFVDGGMSTLDAIKCGTMNGPLTLGPYSTVKSGVIKKGYDADIIALKYNPLENIKFLQNSSNILMVWKGGEILKDIRNPSNSKL